MQGWIGLVAATGQHPEQPALDPLLILAAGVIVLVILWGAAFFALIRQR